MFPPPQNFNNNAPQGNYGYPKLIINDEISQHQKNYSVQSESNYNYPTYQQVQQPVNQPQQYQQPFQQPYQQPYQQPIQQPLQQPQLQQYQQPLLQQQPIYINPQQNQVVPNPLNNQNNGENLGKNKRFGVSVTAIWAIQQLLDLLFIYFAAYNRISYEYSILPIILMFLIPVIVLIINKNQSTPLSLFLFVAFILSSFGASMGFIYLIGQYYAYYMIFQYFQLGTMTTAFFYLLNTHRKLQACQLIKLTTVVLIINLIFYFVQVISLLDVYSLIILIILNIVIWICICSLLSNMLVNTLNKIYTGQNKKIQRDNIWTGYILFKLYFFIPGI